MSYLDRKISSLNENLEMSGIVRSTIFPNKLRDLRKLKGYKSLQKFYSDNPDITYSRLAKIERGQTVPRPNELINLSDHLDCKIDDLFVDITRADFDPVKWAEDHVDASLNNRGGSLDDMKLGAAMRLRRHMMNLSTVDLKPYGIPAATVSRIENADRPFSRWPKNIQNAVISFFGAKDFSGLQKIVRTHDRKGELNETLAEMFSLGALMNKQANAYFGLASSLHSEKARSIARNICIETLSDEASIVNPTDAVSHHRRIPVFKGVSLQDGSLALESTSETIQPRKNGNSESLAIRSDASFFESVFPGSLMIFQKAEPSDLRKEMIIAHFEKDVVTLWRLRRAGQGFQALSNDGQTVLPLSELTGEIYIMKELTLALM